MFGLKGQQLVKELTQNTSDFLPPYNQRLVDDVIDEMRCLFDQNREQVDNRANGEDELTSIQLRHAGLLWNRRCLLAYHFERLQALKRLRWQLGQLSELPNCIKSNLSEDEAQWFNKYCANLGLYMQRLNAGTGLDLTVGYKPPKQLYVQVRCLMDYGDYDLDDGTTVVLSVGSTHYLQRSQCEKLVQSGVLEQIN